MKFSKIAGPYLQSRAVSKHYEANVIRVAKAAGDATVESVNAYLKRRLAKVQASTAKAERTILLCLWKYAYEHDILPAMPKGILKIKVPRKPTSAWTQDQCRMAVMRAAEIKGRLKTGVSASLYIKTWLLLGYETGARRGDIFSFRREHFDGDCLRWTQSKTGDPIVKVLSAACAESVKLMLDLSPDGTVLGWACRCRQAGRRMKDFLESCGLTGSSKWLRRSGATHIEIENPGLGRLHLGHRTVGLAEKHYFDWSQIRRNTPKTPALVSSPSEARPAPTAS